MKSIVAKTAATEVSLPENPEALSVCGKENVLPPDLQPEVPLLLEDMPEVPEAPSHSLPEAPESPSHSLPEVPELSSHSLPEVPEASWHSLPEVPLLPESEKRDNHQIFADIIERRRKEKLMYERLNLAQERMDAAIKAFKETEDEVPVTSSEKSVSKPSVQLNPSHLSVLNSDLGCRFFDHDSLAFEAFFDEELPPVLEILMEHNLLLDTIKNGRFTTMSLSSADKKCVAQYIFFLMSVHPDLLILDQCHYFLLNCGVFKPSFNDILTVLCNWGVNVEQLCKTELLSFPLPPPRQRKLVKMDCIRKTFQYLNFVFTTKMEEEYTPLLEPIVRISLDKNIFMHMWGEILVQIFESLAKSESYNIQDLHLKDLDMTSQVCVCNFLLRRTYLGCPLAWATLQQYFGVQSVEYTRDVQIDNAFNLFQSKLSVIRDARCIDVENAIQLLMQIASNAGVLSRKRSEKTIEDWKEKLLNLLYKISTVRHNNQPYTNPLHESLELSENIKQFMFFIRQSRCKSHINDNVQNYILNGDESLSEDED